MAFDRLVDGMLDLAADVYAAERVKWPAYGGPIKGMIDALEARAASQRRQATGRGGPNGCVSHDAAHRMVQRFPENPSSYLVLSVAYLQRYKNAWKCNDLKLVRQEMVQSVEAARHAPFLILKTGMFSGFSRTASSGSRGCRSHKAHRFRGHALRLAIAPALWHLHYSATQVSASL